MKAVLHEIGTDRGSTGSGAGAVHEQVRRLLLLLPLTLLVLLLSRPLLPLLSPPCAQWAYETDDHGDGVRATAYVSGIGWGLRLRGARTLLFVYVGKYQSCMVLRILGGGLVLNMEDGVSMTMDRDGREVPAYAHDLSVLRRGWG